MSTVARPETEPNAAAPAPFRYGRDSIPDDCVVMIPHQSAEAFERDAPEGSFCEYFHGTICMPSPVSDRHQEVTGFLYYLLAGFTAQHRACQVLMGPAVLRLAPELKPEPDIFVRPVRGDESTEPRAVLVVEVLSPSNRWYDLDYKSGFYRERRIPEIWYVDQSDRFILVDRLEGADYRRIRQETGPLDCPSLPGFRIDVGWLWSEPMPNCYKCLESILAGLSEPE